MVKKFVKITCDGGVLCPRNYIPVNAEDDRSVAKQLEGSGWRQKGVYLYCPDCAKRLNIGKDRFFVGTRVRTTRITVF